ncbi:MAG: hypothetical protein AB4290_17765 [Spirulina sp.]
MGGELTTGNFEKLPNAIEALKQAIEKELDKSLPNEFVFTDLVCNDAKKELREIANRVRTSFNPSTGESHLSSLIVEQDLLDRKKQIKKVAKLISARETIEVGDYFQKMCDAIADYTENQLGWDEEEKDEAIESLKEEYETSQSQIEQFLDFLNDEAMARVRTKISSQIMEAIAQAVTQSSASNEQLLGEYIRRISYFIELAGEQGLDIDLTAVYGDKAEINFFNYVNKSSFFWSLAVWPEWNAQIFEEKILNSEKSNHFPSDVYQSVFTARFFTVAIGSCSNR